MHRTVRRRRRRHEGRDPVPGGGEPLRRSDEHPVSAPVLPGAGGGGDGSEVPPGVFGGRRGSGIYGLRHGEGTGADGEGPDALSGGAGGPCGRRPADAGDGQRSGCAGGIRSVGSGAAVRRTGPAAHPCRVSDDEPAQQLLSGDLWHRDGDRGLQESVRPHLRRRRSRHGAF